MGKKIICCIWILVFVFSVVGCSKTEQKEDSDEPVELKGLMHQDITKVEDLVEDIYQLDTTEGKAYTNGAIHVYSEHGYSTTSVVLMAKCDYCLYGITVGMDIDDAKQIAADESIDHYVVSETYDEYVMENKRYLYLESLDDTTVTQISLTDYDQQGDTEYGDGDDDIFSEPDDFETVLDLNDIGFYDMMGYTDWCKLKGIHYSGGSGYVDVGSNFGKYSFVNGYCMIYPFNTSSMEYSEAYSRIFRCEIVDNDNVILNPKDGGNYEKKNIQILERNVFHSEEYVYLSISDNNSKGPWIPYDFVDWSSGRKEQNDKGETVYRFDIL